MFMIDLGMQSHYTLLAVSPTATPAEIRKAREDQVRDLRTEARRASSERKAELAAQEQALNAAAEVLVRPALKEEYDREHPDLRVFTPQTAAAPLFTDPAQRVGVLYQAIVDHLAHHGARTRPPSDLHRSDFGTDETPNPLLDELIAQWRR